MSVNVPTSSVDRSHVNFRKVKGSRKEIRKKSKRGINKDKVMEK